MLYIRPSRIQLQWPRQITIAEFTLKDSSATNAGRTRDSSLNAITSLLISVDLTVIATETYTNFLQISCRYNEYDN